MKPIKNTRRKDVEDTEIKASEVETETPELAEPFVEEGPHPLPSANAKKRKRSTPPSGFVRALVVIKEMIAGGIAVTNKSIREYTDDPSIATTLSKLVEEDFVTIMPNPTPVYKNGRIFGYEASHAVTEKGNDLMREAAVWYAKMAEAIGKVT